MPRHGQDARATASAIADAQSLLCAPTCPSAAFGCVGLVAVIVAITALGAGAAEPPSPPIEEIGATATLTYSEAVKGENVRIGGGSIVGVIESEARAIGRSSATPTADARFVVSIKPKLRRTAPPQASTVTLEFQEDAWSVDPNIESNHQMQLAGEHAYVLKKLREWRVTLTAEQQAKLDRGETLDFNIVPPFATLGLFSRPQVTVQLRPPDTTPKVLSVVVRAAKADATLTTGRPAIVEVVYNRPNKAASCRVRLQAGSAELVVAAKNSGDNLHFRSDPFRPIEEEDGLPLSTLPSRSTRPTGTP